MMNNPVKATNRKADNSSNTEMRLAKNFDAILQKAAPNEDIGALLYNYHGQHVLCVNTKDYFLKDYFLVNGLGSNHPKIKKITKENLEGWNPGDKIITKNGSLALSSVAGGTRESYYDGSCCMSKVEIGSRIYSKTTDKWRSQDKDAYSRFRGRDF